ncbi:MANSC domain-containing protein 1 [Pempheris klunzingeri]|uniref:MANSC domain-containing protein 1 n=1 Tax=Pempheris klunzingeri TaxID=3127111 RepID=UPI00397FC0EF
MTPPASPPSWAFGLLAAVLLMSSLPVSAVDPETCFSRQHQSVIVNVRQALNRPATAMDARAVQSERDCVLACCSEEVKPGAKCNMAVFNGNKPPREDNCFLFHCQTEQDCPLMKAQDGINTYDIYKGLIHPTTMRPVAMATTMDQTTTTTTTTTHTPTTPTTTTTTRRSTTTPPTTTTTTTTTTTSAPTTTQAPATTAAPPPIIVIATMPVVTPAPTSTTTTATTTTRAPTTKTTTTTPAPPVMPAAAKKPNKTSKKQNKTAKKVKPHPVSTTPSARPATTSLRVVTATKEAAPRTTSKPTTTTTTSLVIVPKDAVQSDHALQNSSAGRGKAAAARGAMKSGVVAFMVLGLAVLTLALAVGGRKAMESFDRRHYTRLELNDLHYEV